MNNGALSKLTAVVLSASAWLLLSPGPVAAHDFGGPTTAGTEEAPPPPQPPCDDACSCEGPGGGGGGNDNRSAEPISYFNGSESLTRTDLVVDGVYPIRLTRKYDSQSTYDSALGHGWAFLHDRALYEYPDGSVIVRRGCGERDRYVYSGGAYVSPVGGMLSTLTENPDGSFELRYVNGLTDYFDSQGRLTAVRERNGNRHEYTYDSRGKLPLTGTSKFAVDPGQPMTVASNHRLTRLEERGADGALTGRFVTFQYDETTGRLQSATTNDGRTVTYVHDVTLGLTKGNLVEVQGLEGIVSTYAYDDPHDSHNLTSIVHSQGRTPVVNTYDDQDRVIRQDEGTRQIEFDYQVPLTKTVVTRTIKDENGQNPYTAVTTYEFDESGRITKIIDPLGHETRRIYSAAKLLIREERWQNDGGTLSQLRAMHWTHDTAGHVLTESVLLDGGETITRTMTYDHDWVASDQVVSSAAPSKLFRTEYTFFYGTDGRPVNIKEEKRRRDDGSFQTTSYTYDTRNRLLTTTLPDGVKVVNEYTGDFVTKTYFEVGGMEIPQMTRRFEYDVRGNLVKEWDARNNLTEYGYDNRQRLVTITNPLAEQTIYSYTMDSLTQIEAGRTTTDGEGQVTKLTYDDRERLTAVQRKNDAGTFVDYLSFTLDSLGQRLSVTDAENRLMRMSYDLLGRTARMVDAGGKETEFRYDAAGNRTLVRDALSREIHYEYDDLNRHTAMEEQGVPDNPRSEYTYDAADNLLSVTDPEDNVTVYDYDALSRITEIVQPLGDTVRYFYDNRDRVTHYTTARGQKIDYAYEAWGYVSQEQWFSTVSAVSPERTITYAYDNDGNLTSTTDDGVQATPMYSIVYDELSRPYDETVRYLPGGDRELQHRYDRYGNRVALTLQDGAAVVYSQSYNRLNQLASASLAGATITLDHYANDYRQRVTLPNGINKSYAYSQSSPLQSITLMGQSGQIASYSYSYTHDDALNVDTLIDPDGVHEYEYDGLNRLTGTTHPIGVGLSNENYTYDRVGNREDPADSSLWQYDGNNRIAASPGLIYSFDSDGNLKSRSDGVTLTHNSRNRLVQYSDGTTTATYLHDSYGRRIAKTVDGTTTWFLWDGSRLLAEYDGVGTNTKRYGYLGIDYVATQVQDSNGIYYVHEDHLQTPRALSDITGQIVWRARYQAFGAAVVDEDVDGDGVFVVYQQRFPGQYSDKESGVHYNYFRDYDPATGRYLQSDPIGQAAGPNTYLYVRGNPISFVDPHGLFVGSAVAAVVGRLHGATAMERAYIGRLLDVVNGAVIPRLPDCIGGYDVGVGLDAIRLYGGLAATQLAAGTSFGLYGDAAVMSTLRAGAGSVTRLSLPVALAAYGGWEIGESINSLYERVSGDTIGGDIYDLFND